MAVRIAIASGKGGTGKTTVATNLYHILSKKDSGRTMLVDCDVEEPNDILFFPDAIKTQETAVNQEIPSIDPANCTYCRKCADYCEFNAITVLPPVKYAAVNASLCHSCGACSVACGHNAIRINDHPVGTISRYSVGRGQGILEGRLEIGSAMQTMVISSLKKSIPTGLKIVILDAPPGTSCPVVETIADADFIILVTEPTPFGLHDFKLMLNLVREMHKSFGLVINKAKLGNMELYNYLHAEEIGILSEIPFNKNYASSYARAELFNEIPVEIEEAYKRLILNLYNKELIK